MPASAKNTLRVNKVVNEEGWADPDTQAELCLEDLVLGSQGGGLSQFLGGFSLSLTNTLIT